jgi:hypothetical protein
LNREASERRKEQKTEKLFEEFTKMRKMLE